VSWLLHNAAVASVLAGPRTFAQWPPYLEALSCAISAADEALVDSLVAPGHPSTPGFTDPRYPVVGRFPRAEPEQAS
jgi:aryl-alcohol dehydrogenase-like predicted oxidoreductase